MENYISNCLQKIEEAVWQNLPAEPECLIAPVKDLLERGGKRWRPLLALLISDGLGGAVLPLTTLIEFSHNASLIHDDIEDNSPLRRGKPACHILYGNDTAINSGSFLYFLSAVCIEKWNAHAEQKAAIYNLWVKYLCRLHKGQAFDIFWHSNFSMLPSVSDYLQMCADKTGCLSEFAAAAAIHTVNSTAFNKYDYTKLLKASCDLGVAFQIIDDVKNLRGGISGKKPGDDIVEGKKSLPVIIYCERAKTAAVSFMTKTFETARREGIESPVIQKFIAALEEDGAVSEAEARGRKMLDGAFSIFENFPWPDKKTALNAFKDFRELIA